MTPKKKSEYRVPKLKDFSAKTLDGAAGKLLTALKEESEALLSEESTNDLQHDDKWRQLWDVFKTFRDRWIARKDGIATQIKDMWLMSTGSLMLVACLMNSEQGSTRK
jgi:hypothetical protein